MKNIIMSFNFSSVFSDCVVIRYGDWQSSSWSLFQTKCP